MLVEIEDLAGKENPCAERDGADGVQGASHRRETSRHERAGNVENGNEQDDEREARLRRHRVPVRRHKKQYAGADGQRPERDCD